MARESRKKPAWICDLLNIQTQYECPFVSAFKHRQTHQIYDRLHELNNLELTKSLDVVGAMYEWVNAGGDANRHAYKETPWLPTPPESWSIGRLQEAMRCAWGQTLANQIADVLDKSMFHPLCYENSFIQAAVFIQRFLPGAGSKYFMYFVDVYIKKRQFFLNYELYVDPRCSNRPGNFCTKYAFLAQFSEQQLRHYLRTVQSEEPIETLQNALKFFECNFYGDDQSFLMASVHGRSFMIIESDQMKHIARHFILKNDPSVREYVVENLKKKQSSFILDRFFEACIVALKVKLERADDGDNSALEILLEFMDDDQKTRLFMNGLSNSDGLAIPKCFHQQCLQKFDFTKEQFVLKSLNDETVYYFSDLPLHKMLRSLNTNQPTVVQEVSVDAFAKLVPTVDACGKLPQLANLAIQSALQDAAGPRLVDLESLFRSRMRCEALKNAFMKHVDQMSDRCRAVFLDNLCDDDVVVHRNWLLSVIQKALTDGKVDRARRCIDAADLDGETILLMYRDAKPKVRAAFTECLQLVECGYVFEYVDALIQADSDVDDISVLPVDFSTLDRDSGAWYRLWSSCSSANENLFTYLTCLLLRRFVLSLSDAQVQTILRTVADNDKALFADLLESNPQFVSKVDAAVLVQLDEKQLQKIVVASPQTRAAVCVAQLDQVRLGKGLHEEYILFWNDSFAHLTESKAVETIAQMALVFSQNISTLKLQNLHNVSELPYSSETSKHVKSFNDFCKVQQLWCKDAAETVLRELVANDAALAAMPPKDFSQLFAKLPADLQPSDTLFYALLAQRKPKHVLILMKHYPHLCSEVDLDDNNAIPASDDNYDAGGSECVICMEQKRCMASPKCGHVCLCETCATSHDLTTCPICRKKAKKFIRVYI